RGPVESPWRAPLALFAAAAPAGLLGELELACLSAALSASAAAGLSGRLFLNVSPHSLLRRSIGLASSRCSAVVTPSSRQAVCSS
ncbi:MAG TPA: hypothetical protein VM713_10865, partial [Steroidobacteraceae bacterium]|nr:hypothetical protein [Steroidobacteraceae bacterium]